MAIRCPNCAHEYDVTLFVFGRSIRCDCGTTVDARDPHRPDAGGARPGRRPEANTPEPDPPADP